ncbi:MAG: hypothetical protein R2769_15650 [Saprospiraceae bacterium]
MGFSSGYKETAVQVAPLTEGSTKRIDATLVPIESNLEIVVTESRMEDAGMIKENSRSNPIVAHYNRKP